MKVQHLNSRKYPAQPLRGFWRDSEARKKSPCVSRPDLVDERNRTTDRTPRGLRNIKHREDKDCAVRALAICANIPYDRAHSLLAKNRRTNNGATNTSAVIGQLMNLGYRVESTTISARTVRSVERELIKGVYLLFVTGHFVALVDGRIYDWSRGSLKRVQAVYRIKVK